MLNQDSYDSQRNRENIIKLRNILRELPLFCGDFFRAIEPTTSILTRINYAYDLRLFFEFLTNEIEDFAHITPFTQFTLQDLNRVRAVHIEMFLEYLTYYSRPSAPEVEHQNHDSGKARKLSTLRSFLAYFFKNERLDRNVASLVDYPKISEKPIIRLEADEVARLLDLVETGQGLTERQKRYHNYTRQRDITILMVFLGTGIRISECVGLNISDLDFSINGFRVTRKGGNQVILYFGDEVRKALLAYLEERKKIDALPGHEDALFLSMQRKRISNRAVQNLVKKYAKLVSPLKNISPHKLRSTYGTALYQETGDIYLVADVLGHKDVNTTRKHYAAISDEKRRMAARVVKLRED